MAEKYEREMKCKCCGKVITTIRKNQKFCTYACRDKFNKLTKYQSLWKLSEEDQELALNLRKKYKINIVRRIRK